MTPDNGSAPDGTLASTRHGGFVELRQPFSDQSEADQSGSDADRMASAEDQAASTADHLAAREDQMASDRDQVLADSQQAAAKNLTAGEELAYEVAREERITVTKGRQQSRFAREQTARLRRVTAALRDRVSRPRMRASAIRKRLIAEGETPEMAVRWCDAWELVADSRGLRHDADSWNQGTQWIWTERAAGRSL